MHLRPKTTRRLLILGGVLLGVAALAVTVWIVSSRKTAARIAKAREGAMAAYAKGDYVAALPLFAEYLTDTRTAEKAPGKADVEALLAYGKSRLAIPMAKGEHLRQAKQAFERYLQLKPGDRDAQNLLLGLYPRIHYNEEALALADNVLASDPKDVPALRVKIAAYADQRKYKDALAASEELLKVVPDDLDTHATLQTLMITMDKTGDEAPAQVVKRYEGLLAQHENDPRFELLAARAYLLAGQYDLGKRDLKLAAGRPQASDPAVAAKLTPLLDKLKLFDESNSVLERLAATADEDPIHQRPLVRRLWQSGVPKEVLKRTEKQDPASPTADTDLLAYRALSLYDLNRPADAAPIVEALTNRKDDMAAVAWSTALRTREGENLSPRDRTKRYMEALERAPQNEAIHYFLAEAYLALDEFEPALRKFNIASRLAPNWAAPAAQISRTLVATGRSGDAVEFARVAFQRAPKLFGTRVQYVLAVFADQQQDPRPGTREKLLGIVEEIQQKLPGEPETLHVYASLLSRTRPARQSGRGDQVGPASRSAGAARDAAQPRAGQLRRKARPRRRRARLRREDVRPHAGRRPAQGGARRPKGQDEGRPQALGSGQADGREDQPRDLVAGGVAVPRLGRRRDGGQRLDPARGRQPGRPRRPARDPPLRRAKRDKAFWLRTIDRLKKLSAEDAVVPRLERRRWLLAGDPSKAQSAEAITLLSDIDAANIPEVHRLLGIAQEKTAALSTGSPRETLLNNAARELETALGTRGTDETVANDLTRVYRALGRNTDADRVMAKVAERAADLGIDGRKRTARMLIGAGQLTRAIEVLEPIGDGQDPGRDAMLCGLYRRTGQNEKAAGLYGKLLTDERAEAATLADGAEFFAAMEKPEEAAKFIARIKSTDVAAATRELLLAEYAEHFGTDAEALQGYEAAAKADPGQPAAWHGLVGYHLRELQFPEALAAADRGLKQLPDDRTLQSLRARASALQSYQQDPNLKTLADELAADPESAAITDMLRVLGQAKAANEPLATTVPKLRELADRNPELLRLQRYVAEGYVKLGQYDDAETVAARTAARLPNDREAAKLLTQVYSARPGKDKWTRVLEAARQWRQRSLDAPLEADIAIAQTLVEMRRPGDAVTQLKPYVIAAPPPRAAKSGSRPATQPDVNPGVLSLYAKALLRSGDEKSATALLAPLAKDSADWRRVWLKLGTAGLDAGTPAVRWVEQIVPMIPADSTTEQAALAETWCAIGTQFASRPALDKAKPLIDQMTADPKMGAEGWRLLAAWAEAGGDMEQATRAYRELLKVQPDNADVQNNLAYALLSTGSSKDLPEARKLAEAAATKSPGNATYQDTLARVYLAAGELPAAEKAFKQALAAEKGSIEAMIGLADVHARSGRPEKVKELLAQINDALASGTALSPALQRQLDGVRQSVKNPVQSGRIE